MSIPNLLKKLEIIMRKDEAINPGLQTMTQLSWMFFLKLWDDREAERELEDDSYKSPIPKKYRWRNWAASSGKPMTGESLRTFIDNDLFPALRDLPAEGKYAAEAQVVRSVFQDAYNFMKDGNLLRLVIDAINEDIDFTKKSDTHIFGTLYEELLSGLQAGRKAGGEFYTPRAVTQFIVDIIDPGVAESVLDPACGTGGFLTAALEAKRRKAKTPKQLKKAQATIFGVEKKPIPHMLCTTNMILHGIEVPSNIRRDNLLSRPLTSYGESDRVDIIIANPPYGGTEKDIVESNFPKAHYSRETFDLFMLLFMRLLRKGTGRAAIVLPDGFLFGEQNKTELKKKLLAEFNLHSIVRLPKGVFAPYTPIKTNILFFDSSGPTKEVWFFEHPFPPGQSSYSKTKPIGLDEFELEKEWWHNRKPTQHAWKLSLREIEARGYNLDVPNPTKAETQLRSMDELLAEYEAASSAAQAARKELVRLVKAAQAEE